MAAMPTRRALKPRRKPGAYKDDASKKGMIVGVRFTSAEREALERAARAAEKTLSEFIRDAALQRVSKD